LHQAIYDRRQEQAVLQTVQRSSRTVRSPGRTRR